MHRVGLSALADLLVLSLSHSEMISTHMEYSLQCLLNCVAALPHKVGPNTVLQKLGLFYCLFRNVRDDTVICIWSLVTICGDACPLSCVSAEACFTSWPNAQDRRDGEVN